MGRAPTRDPRLLGPSSRLGETRSDPVPGMLAENMQTARHAMMNPISTARGQILGQAKTHAINQICNFLHLPSSQVQQGVALVDLTRSAFSGSFVGLLKLHSAMFMAVFDAYMTGRRISANIAAAHAFGYWLGQSQGAARPTFAASGRAAFQEARDRLYDDGVSAHTWFRRWETVCRETLQALDDSIDLRAARNVLQQNHPALRAHRMDDNSAMIMIRHEIAAGFDHNYTAAAAVFFADRIRNEHGAELEVSVRSYRDCPYRPNR